jgi:deazaflavin-dependent oxidoreductase (nitroreductase family)
VDEAHAGAQLCWLTTRGRTSGAPRTIEIWFALSGGTVYLLAGNGNRSNWVRNVRRHPAVTIRVGEERFSGTGRVLEPGDEDALARRLVLEKYVPVYAGDLTDWGRTSLAVAIDLASA